MIPDELPHMPAADGLGDDVEEALRTSGREVVAGFSGLGADLARLPRTSDPLWRASISNDVDRWGDADDGTAADRASEARIARLVEDLAGEYRDVAEPALIDAEVRSEFSRLSQESTVDDFVPMLTERVVRDHLNELQEHH